MRRVSVLKPLRLLFATAGMVCLFGGTFVSDIRSSKSTAVPFMMDHAIRDFGKAFRDSNAISIENALPGNPPSDWEINGVGDPTIQGFATDISIDKGETVHFKIDTDAASYHVDIYRLGFYQGHGARKVNTTPIAPDVTLPQMQPAPLHDPITGLTDCGNWAVSAHWDVPLSAVSGVYLAKLTRHDTSGASHVAFVVRDDSGSSDLLFQTSDTTWQAYNTYGGDSLYTGSTSFPSGHAVKVSYNRPFLTRGVAPEDWVMNAEFPMIRWLEANGFDVSYSSDVDTDRRGSLLLNHRAFLSVGHDEYWSAGQRANVEAARAAGVHLAFFSGNECYWKIRWEPSIDGSGTPYRTLVCYKEGTLGENQCGSKCDPLSGIWTGLWRDGCSPTYALNDGCLPENALSGQISWQGSTGAIEVPGAYRQFRFWRNTSIAGMNPNAIATLAAGSLGYEWDWQQYEVFYPPGRVRMSTTILDGKTHHLSLYRHASGALVFGAGTVQWSWGLDGVHDRGSSFPDVTMQQATVNLFAEMGAQPATIQPSMIVASQSTDASPPTSVIGSLTNGDSVASGSPVTISGTAIDLGGGVVAGVEVSVDGGATWQRASGFENWTYNWVPVGLGGITIKTRAVDDLGNLESPEPGIHVSVAPQACPCSIWSPAAVPGNPDPGDTSAIEVGVKFRSDVDGFITGIRFYKAPANTGTHIGKLYASDGSLLSSATFSAESASGWQEVSFGAPVAISQDVTYVASCWMPNGHYSFDGGYFTNSGVDNPPLRALQNGVDGPNGVYHYLSQGFPTSTFNSSHYWVDVVFDSEAGPDTTSPLVINKAPSDGAVGVAVSANVTATFSEPINASTLGGTSFMLSDPLNNPIPATVSYSSGPRIATIDPMSSLANSTTYTARLTTSVQDLSGNPLAEDVTWSFTTAAPPSPPPDEGSGGPILVISSTSNPMSRYYAEILRNEGLNYFTISDVSLVTPAVLNAYDIVILGEFSVAPAQVSMLADWVTAGGNLIAMRPGPELAALMGIAPQGTVLSSARPYMLINTVAGPGVGLVNQTIQFHGAADLHLLSGAVALATLYSDPVTSSAFPAVTLRSVGVNGGQAAAFAFDLARSVVYTRQGNPAWSGQERDGIGPIRSNDLFYGNAAGDPQPDWVNLEKVAIPQADELQRLLANMILQMNLDRMPLPRFWYFPRDYQAVVIMTGDQHGCCEPTRGRFAICEAQSPAGCSVEDWECVRASSYVYSSGDMTNAEAITWTNKGFELGSHINTGCADWTPASLDGFFSSQLGLFSSLYPGIPLPVSNRTHCIAWSDYVTQPQIEQAYGIRLDTNYYYWPSGWVANRPGFFTGSGMPMRFATADGTMIDCYQAVSQMTDESGQSFPYTIDTLLDRAIGSEGYFGAFCANMHTDSSPHAGCDAIVSSSLARGVPVVSGRQMLTWLDGRNGSAFSNLNWASRSGHDMSFTVTQAAGARNLRGMLLVESSVGPLSGIWRDGNPIAYSTRTVKGMEYALFAAESGDYVASYETESTPPVISGIAAHPLGGGVATITWLTNEPADSHVEYGVAPNALTGNADDAGLLTSHSLELTGLLPGTSYYFRVRSADAVGNSATSPALPYLPLTFVTPSEPCFVDDVAADFSAGNTSTDTTVASAGDGEIILRPTLNSEFSGNTLDANWAAFSWSPGGTALVSSGQLTVDGTRVNTEPATGFGPGCSLEFVATFGAASFQHVGFGGGNDLPSGEIFNIAPWAIFSTGTGGSSLQARTWSVGPLNDFTIPGSFLGSAHRYRIDWKTTGFDFFVDGVLVHSSSDIITTNMRPAISDYSVGGPGVSVDWIRLSPYSASGSFSSRVFDAGDLVTWGVSTWSATTPPGTGISMAIRTGNTPIPDGTWSAFASISYGGNVGVIARYIQYRAELSTADANTTPALDDVTITCASAGDTTPPVIDTCPTIPTLFTGPAGVDCTAVLGDYISTLVAHDDITPPGGLLITQDPPAGTQVSNGAVITFTVSDAAANSSTCTSSVQIEDDTPPVLGGPSDITVPAHAGLSSAVVTFSVSASDNCDPSPVVICAPTSGSNFPVGTTTVLCTATDVSGKSSQHSFLVTVRPVSRYYVDVELSGNFVPVTRCIHATAGRCDNVADFALSFTDHDGDDSNNNGIADATEGGIELPATPVRASGAVLELGYGAWTTLCVKDAQHTLSASAPLTICGTDYCVNSVLTLLGGDTDNDDDIDINDVTYFLYRFGQSASAGACPWSGLRDPDFSCNGTVGTEDYTFVASNWQQFRSCDCTQFLQLPPVRRMGGAMAAAELDRDVAARVDLNRDGVIDVHDVRIFERRNRLGTRLSSAMEAVLSE